MLSEVRAPVENMTRGKVLLERALLIAFWGPGSSQRQNDWDWLYGRCGLVSGIAG